MRGPSSRVIKKGSPEGEPSAAGPGDVLSDARARAREIVSAAEVEAASLRDRIAAEVERARSAAIAEGLSEGMARAAAVLARAGALSEARLAGADKVVVAIALEVARQIVGRELAADPEAVVDVAKRALRAAAGAGEVQLRVACADVATVTAADGALRTLVDRGLLAVVEDSGLQRGEVVVEASGGRVDARIAAQLEAFRRALEAGER